MLIKIIKTITQHFILCSSLLKRREYYFVFINNDHLHSLSSFCRRTTFYFVYNKVVDGNTNKIVCLKSLLTFIVQHQMLFENVVDYLYKHLLTFIDLL